MKKRFTLLAACVILAGVGCAKEDPRDRPGFVDTSDPSKVGATMAPPPKAKSSTSLSAGATKPPGAK